MFAIMKMKAIVKNVVLMLIASLKFKINEIVIKRKASAYNNAKIAKAIQL